uniref:Uncharacterized protein n=1 Tax=Rhizophora mucronata TaxID=61149 RepID=A0A2P2PWM1_RHIMU
MIANNAAARINILFKRRNLFHQLIDIYACIQS